MDVNIDKKYAQYLQYDLCSKLGFCSMGNEYNYLISQLPLDISTFVNGIFKAEGLDPEIAERKLWKDVREYVLNFQSSYNTRGS
ncbi:MAG: hypothetical protein VYD53_18170 [Pseudomonadota bacterium]|nr:hypothetical protein [Pseudomonadota bacterium]